MEVPGTDVPGSPRQGYARRPQAVPGGDEREGANLEQPDSGEAGGAPNPTQPNPTQLEGCQNPTCKKRVENMMVTVTTHAAGKKATFDCNTLLVFFFYTGRDHTFSWHCTYPLERRWRCGFIRHSFNCTTARHGTQTPTEVGRSELSLYRSGLLPR